MRNCRQCELELSAAWAAQAQTTKPEDALEMCKQHLNSFALAARAIECFGLGQCPGYVTGLLVDTALKTLWIVRCQGLADAALKAVTPRGIGVRPSSGRLLNLNTYDLDRFILLRLSERLVPRPLFFDFCQ